MTSNTLFSPFPKLAEFNDSSKIYISEKLDGISSAIRFASVTEATKRVQLTTMKDEVGEELAVLCQSGGRFLNSINGDNYGFGEWAADNKNRLYFDLGFGVHHGEWIGLGIKREYGMRHREFALFDLPRWESQMFQFGRDLTTAPLLSVVDGWSGMEVVEWWVGVLRGCGSFLNTNTPAEGMVLHDPRNNIRYKYLLNP